jgi:hypothetical protein
VSDLQSIHIDSGVKRIAINDDPNRVIEFNPHDTIFAEKLYRTYTKMAGLEKAYSERAAALTESIETDDLDVPTDFEPFVQLRKEMLDVIVQEIDNLFGAGTSDLVFQGDITDYTVTQFLEGMIQYIMPERAEAMRQYMPPEPKQATAKKEPAGSIPPELVIPLIDDYRAGKSFPQLARKYQIKESTIKAAFERLKASRE